MMKNMRRGIPNLLKEGTEHLSGIEQAVIKNCRACKELADLTRTSMGPNGQNKLIVNHLEKIFVTSDCATIMKEMEIEHPAAKMVVMAAQMQESEIGDGSNFVVCFAGELMKHAEALIRMGMTPTQIVDGYTIAGRKALELLESPELTVWNVEGKEMYSKETLTKAVRSAVGAKQYGYEDLLAPLVAEACLTVMPPNPANFVVDNVRVVKILGGSIHGCELIKGMVIPHDSIGSLKRVKDAKIAVFTCSIGLPEIETKATIEITSAKELMEYNTGEEEAMEKQIRAIADSGVKVVVTGGAVDDIAAHFLEKYGLMTVKLTSKFELRRLCRSVKARALVTLGEVPAQYQGFCSNVYVREIGLKRVTVFSQERGDQTNVATILLRASTENHLNDIERAIDDGVNVIRAMTKDGRFVAGAGAIDIELARLLAQHAATQAGLEQHSIKKFAEAFEVIPRTLAENAGLDAVQILAQLYAAHQKGEAKAGVSIEDGTVKDMVAEKQVYDSLLARQQAIKLVVDAVTTVLRVDQIIRAKPAGGPRVPSQRGHDDDD